MSEVYIVLGPQSAAGHRMEVIGLQTAGANHTLFLYESGGGRIAHRNSECVSERKGVSSSAPWRIGEQFRMTVERNPVDHTRAVNPDPSPYFFNP
ncbi:hypothetical protein OE88DRAFT_1656885 [Heliocybe sulcata]|uniref:Uncharacterized protein n=1 Tax=Heliocybe sulcata TaxID=5364 RepID=A0A5C3N7M5_9AGAM|nr:hypothetical protein OE88DRAFT_1656885 [Heliocybe sulcata]